ncbi:hypothetical protein L1987_62843 [Smallanthus sonchifolius]|uniref:Uncharacterized protein n=1 Tax=Smallanthus sonchifolius TaxID=185202 RepID=A0ACB9CBL2_9ASTR|nr:hypothetical protein L1987_62843 [Smallanthus sonchifolius]
MFYLLSAYNPCNKYVTRIHILTKVENIYVLNNPPAAFEYLFLHIFILLSLHHSRTTGVGGGFEKLSMFYMCESSHVPHQLWISHRGVIGYKVRVSDWGGKHDLYMRVHMTVDPTDR